MKEIKKKKRKIKEDPLTLAEATTYLHDRQYETTPPATFVCHSPEVELAEGRIGLERKEGKKK